MERALGARKLVADLVKDEQIEVRRAEIIGRDLAQWCDSHGRAPTADELEAWLGKHAQVLELYAGTKLLDTLIEQYLCAPLEKVFVNAEHPELEAHLHEGPDVPEPYMVYGDWLQEQSDVRGELIALGVAATTTYGGDGWFGANSRFVEYLAKHEERLFGKVTQKLRRPVELTWKYGVIRSIAEARGQFADEQPTTAGLWEELLRLRVCRLVQSIFLGQPMGIGVEEALAENAAPTLKHLEIHVRHRLPSLLMTRPLRSLSLFGGSVTLRPDSLPETLDKLELGLDDLASGDDSITLCVRELRIRTNPKLAGFASRLRVPRVERLHLDLGDEEFDVRMLASLALPMVKHLAIAGGRIDQGALVTLTQLPFTRQLTSLALTTLELSDAKLQLLLESPALASLRKLDVSSNELTKEALARVRGRVETVSGDRQMAPGSGDERRRVWTGASVGYTGYTGYTGYIDENGWQQVGRDGEIVWALYTGSADYRMFISSTDDTRFACSCPSRYRPCKHVNALRVRALEEIPEAPVPFDLPG